MAHPASARITFTAALVGAALGLCATGPATAQPTAEQQNALRNNCRSDFMSSCAGVQPGGAEALQCLQRNRAKLSPACQSAVNVLAPPAASAVPAAPAPAAVAAPAAAPPSAATATTTPAAAARAPTPEQQAALRQFCGDDYMAKCGNVPPASSQAMQCLQSNAATLSPNCRGALALFNPGSAAPAAAPPARAPAPTAPATAAKPVTTTTVTTAPAQPTQAQRDAMRQACQSDFMARCTGVQPGGPDALRCLQGNSAQLSPNCRSALAAISGGTPAATPAAAPAAAAVTAAPAAPPTAQQQSAIKAACGRDFMTNCPGITPGGQEAFACLQRNASRLSPDCKAALASVTGGATPAAAVATPAPTAPGGFPLRRAIRERMMGQ